MASGIYNQFKTDLMSGLAHLLNGGDAFKVSLYNVSFAFTATDTTYSTTNELATANGYTQGAKALGAQAIAGTTTVKWTADPTVWTSSGAGFTAYFAVIWDDTNADHLVCCVDFGGAKTASGGGTFTITWDANGILSLA
jgi:hypothetical protein